MPGVFFSMKVVVPFRLQAGGQLDSTLPRTLVNPSGASGGIPFVPL